MEQDLFSQLFSSPRLAASVVLLSPSLGFFWAKIALRMTNPSGVENITRTGAGDNPRRPHSAGLFSIRFSSLGLALARWVSQPVERRFPLPSNATFTWEPAQLSRRTISAQQMPIAAQRFAAGRLIWVSDESKHSFGNPKRNNSERKHENNRSFRSPKRTHAENNQQNERIMIK